MSPGPDEIINADKSFVWHPYTPMQHYVEKVTPLVVERASGARLFDSRGRSYLDGNASWWTALLGHGHPRLVAALKEQADRLCHTSLAGVTHESAAFLAQELIDVAPPGASKVFFSDNGSTSVEVAIKLALQFWAQSGEPEKRLLIALEDAFHGETLGATALGGVEVFRRPFADLVLECRFLPSPTRGAAQSLATLRKILEKDAKRTAALVVEPMVQGAAGMRTYDAEFLRQARRLTQEFDILLVADEVFAGYGRTGPMWACDHAGIAPDILCTAKGFSGGMLPIAATLVTERIFDAFRGDPARAFYYGHTFCGNPLGARVAREVLAIYREEQVLERAREKAARISEAFEAMQALPGVAETRSLGMMGALDLEGPSGYLERTGWRVYDEALARGAYLRPMGNVVYVTPPLNIPDADLEELLQIVADSVKAAKAA